MRMTRDVPCGLDPQFIKHAFVLAWRACEKDRGMNRNLPKVIRTVKNRREGQAWVSRDVAYSGGPLVLYINASRSYRTNVYDLYEALRGNTAPDHLFDHVSDGPFPKKTSKPPKKPTHADTLALTEKRIEEWEQRQKDSLRTFRRSRTVLRKLRASARYLRKTIQSAPLDPSVSDTQLATALRLAREEA